MFPLRLIKKYPNRRLYDTKLSRYVTLVEVRDLIMEGWEIQVIDTSNGEEITRSILLQIVIDEESSGNPLFSSKMLCQLIRFYGGTVQGIFTRYLEESLNLFTQQQKQVQEDPFTTMTRIAQNNAKMWSDMQQLILNSAGFGTKSHDDEKK
ncbi:hypothetical protein TI04_08790 [Achromatium sp. WMS2]|nr:hypothetical protein TI04_08790 [Achromatium sp. WMS2]